MKKILLTTALFCSATHLACAEEYTLFNPVPKDKLRGMNTERPSKTDSAVTLDAGHVQIESSLYNSISSKSCSQGNCTKTREQDIGASTMLRLGLTQATDVQLIFTPSQDVTTKDQAANTSTKQQGFGDTTLRFKYNAWGNDGGTTALAAVAFVKLPTNQDHIGNNSVEGGAEIPFAINLPDNWSINAMTQMNVLVRAPNTSYYTAYANSAALGKNLTDKLSAYTEFYTYRAALGNAKWQNTVDFGTVYAVTDNFHVDTGINIGVTTAAPNNNWFVGAAYRF